MTLILAVIPEAWLVAFPVIVLVVQIIQAFVLFSLSAKASRSAAMEHDLKRGAEGLIDQKFATLRAELKTDIAVMTQQLTQINGRLIAGDAHLQRLDERDHAVEVRVLEAIGELKDVVATKEDLQQLRREMNRA